MVGVECSRQHVRVAIRIQIDDATSYHSQAVGIGRRANGRHHHIFIE